MQESHFVGPPLCFPLSNSPVEQVNTHPHPFGEGRGRRGCGPFHASQRIGDSAHIPHERGGAHRWVAARGWEGLEGVEDGWWW